MNENLCPCCSGKNYEECCKPVITGERKAATPEELMRARYSAYAKTEIDFIIDSTHKEKREENDRGEIENWSKKSDWLGLEIIKTADDPEKADTGYVEFIATYAARVHAHAHAHAGPHPRSRPPSRRATCPPSQPPAHARTDRRTDGQTFQQK